MRPKASTTCLTIASISSSFAQIDGDRQSAPVFLPHFFRRRVGICLFEIDASDIAAFGGKSRHDGRTEFTVAARDDRYFSFELHDFTEPAASRQLSAGHNFFS